MQSMRLSFPDIHLDCQSRPKPTIDIWIIARRENPHEMLPDFYVGYNIRKSMKKIAWNLIMPKSWNPKHTKNQRILILRQLFCDYIKSVAGTEMLQCSLRMRCFSPIQEIMKCLNELNNRSMIERKGAS